jgi:Flp pilus assembly protein TadD
VRRIVACALVLILIIGASMTVSRLEARQERSPAGSATARSPEEITIDYPAEDSIFPPEMPPPTFLWRDPEIKNSVWLIRVAFADNSRQIQVRSTGELMRIGEIDPRCVTPTNAPVLSPQQAETRTWKPDEGTWNIIKKHSVRHPATVTITGFREENPNQPVSHGEVRIQTSRDPVGAPIFYRDVPLMPSEGEKGTIKPLPPAAIGLIKWRLRNVGESQSRTLMENLPTCANCHSFSLDGRTLGLDVDGPQNDKGLYALVSIKKDTSIRNEDVIKWSSFQGKLGDKLRAAFMSQVSPDGRYVVTTIEDHAAQTGERRKDLLDKYYSANFRDYRFLQVFFPTRGILAWYSRATAHLQPLPGADDSRYVQTDGVWSPDGRYIVFARAGARPPYPNGWTPAQYANDPNETQIQYDLYRIPFNDGKGGQPEPIAGASQNGMSNNFPKVSPDGRWIVFVQCRNGQLMRPDSRLYIVPFEGGTARRMNCNTSLMNSWHSFSPNGRWLVFSSKSRSPYTQMYLTHLDDKGNDSPPILIENATAANRAVNIPEFVNIAPDGLLRIDAPATDFYRAFDQALEVTNKNRPEEAVAAWKKAVTLNPEEAKAHFNLALALDNAGLRDEAMTEYRRTVELDPENAPAYTNLAVSLARMGNLNDAIDCLVKSAALNPENAKTLNNLGAALIQAGRFEEAIGYCRKAVEIDPEDGDAQNSLGSALAMTGELNEAISHLEKAVALSSDSFEYRYNLGRFLAAAGRYQEAVPHFEQAVSLSGGREPLSLEMLAAMYSEVGRPAEAVLAARRALDLATSQNNQELVDSLKSRIADYEARASAQGSQPPSHPPPQP